MLTSGGVDGDGLFQVGLVDQPVVVRREDVEPEAVGLEAAAGLEHGGVLGGLPDRRPGGLAVVVVDGLAACSVR